MRVVILSWEFPPRVVGDMAYYVNRLAVELVKKKVDTYVVTYHETLRGLCEGVDGVKVYRVTSPVKAHINILTWTLTLSQEFIRATSDIRYFTGKVDVIDAHEWHCVAAAATLKKSLGIPFVFSVHSLEEHRSHGSTMPLSWSIGSIEWLGGYESKKVIVNSDWMKGEMNRIYKVPLEKIEVASPDSPDWADKILKVYEEASKG